MSVWDNYFGRVGQSDGVGRDAILSREQRILKQKIQKSLSWHPGVLVDGVLTDVAIIDSDNLDTKSIFSMPPQELDAGSLVEWSGQRWLITEKDFNTEVYTRCTMRQCNYLLKWVNSDGVIVSRWCIVEDGTKLRRTTVRMVWHTGNGM